jgi:hypothetical protein
MMDEQITTALDLVHSALEALGLHVELNVLIYTERTSGCHTTIQHDWTHRPDGETDTTQ